MLRPYGIIMSDRKYNLAVVGATGAVGREMIAILEERDFPTDQLCLLASKRTAGEKISYKRKDITVEVLGQDSFKGIDIALFSAGASISKTFAPHAVDAGAVVVDNTSAFRMDPEVPLVVPEVNPECIADYKDRGIIANPNCSTIQLVAVLKPLADRVALKRVVVSTYQSTSGAGQKAINELSEQVRMLFNQKPIETKVLPQQIAFNCIPHIDVFMENGYTKEEMKMIEESRKILQNDSLRITITCVRVPVFHSHAESVNIETEGALSAEEARQILARAPGLEVNDDPASASYPLGIEAAGKDPVFVGRIRADESVPHGLNLWIVADNLRKGAALNAVQIAEILKEQYL
jgi:aspartate-semialdehyde dehydrogenase